MPCARCKRMKKKCEPNCDFALFFPAEKTEKFDRIHWVFGADNFMRMLKELRPDQQGHAVESMAYEAEIRAQDPVHGCFGKIKALEQERDQLKREKAILSEKVKSLVAAQSNHNPSPASPSRKLVALEPAQCLPKPMPSSL